MARSALLLASVAVVALVVISHAATRLSNETLLSMGSQKELERLERDTFESPDSTYAKALAQLHRAKVTQVKKRTVQTVGGGFLEQCASKDPLDRRPVALSPWQGVQRFSGQPCHRGVVFVLPCQCLCSSWEGGRSLIGRLQVYTAVLLVGNGDNAAVRQDLSPSMCP